VEAGLLTRRRTAAAAIPAIPAAAVLVPITAVAALLRFWAVGSVAGNPFYDAAVRSMADSWHNFFYGAFEPGGQVSVDKIPVDLWLQVACVKLFGFTPVAVRLPGLLAGTLAVAVLYDLVRRVFWPTAGLVAAAALAVMPISVLTARSDTMDSAMMLLDLLAAWLVVWGAQRRTLWPLAAAGAVLGLAFNVKLFEALIVLPALGLLALLAAASPWRRRALALAAGLAAFVVVSLAWVIATSAAPLGSRPFPLGSTNGSIWNVVFAYNGIDRLTSRASSAALALDPPGPFRLLSTGGRDYASLIGSPLLAALVLGGMALLVFARRRGRPLTVATTVFLGIWLATGVVLLSHMQRLQPRYLEAFTPAVAAVVGAAVGVLVAHIRHDRAPALALAGGALATVVAGVALVDPPAWAWVVAFGAVALAAPAAVLRRPGALAACTAVAVLAVPAASSLAIAGGTQSDAGLATPMPPSEVAKLSAFLTAHQGGAFYEVTSSSVFKTGRLIVRDGRPVLMLASYDALPLLAPAQLARLVAQGKVRYALISRARCSARDALACVPVVEWARAHSVDVSRRAGLPAGTLSEFTR
jgi:4-amino-4-deoxy-L-arabinose transferase-like glycosyltransferase